MSVQDIQIPDESLREQFITYWQSNDYASAFSLLENTQLANKVNIASLWNTISSNIVTTEKLSDPTFKSNKIQVASTPPTLTSGEIYFQTI